MKFYSSLLVSASVATVAVNAFVPSSLRPSRGVFVSRGALRMAEETTEESTTVPHFAKQVTKPLEVEDKTEENAKKEEVDDDLAAQYERIGIKQEELALGVDPTELLQWIGSKADLNAKFRRDNKGMTEESADEEISKFLMDAEMVNAYIKFEKDKELNPPNLREEAEQNIKDPKTIATYAAWLVGGASFGYIRNVFIEPKYASGEWEEVHIELPNWFDKGAETAVEGAAAVTTDAAASAAVDAVADVAAISSAVEAVQVTSDVAAF